jgi:hypothetical protein
MVDIARSHSHRIVPRPSVILNIRVVLLILCRHVSDCTVHKEVAYFNIVHFERLPHDTLDTITLQYGRVMKKILRKK